MASNAGQNGAATEVATCVIADDHFVVREGLRARIGADGWIRIIGEASSGREALELLRSQQPHLALVDLRMPDLDGLKVTSAVRDEGLPTRVIIFSALTEASMLHRAFESGAAGYIAKDAEPDTFLRALRQVYDGKRFVDPALAADMMQSKMSMLSARERQVLELFAQGKSNTEVAEALFVTTETVKSHVSNILDKLDADTRAHAVAIALRESIID